jgi:hypothetical protein
MSKRSLPILLLTVAFLLSAWGNVIAAAFCPRYLSNRERSIKPTSQESKQVGHKPSCHHEMADMEMGDMQMDGTEIESETAGEAGDNSIIENPWMQVASESDAEQVAINLPTEPCGHCWMHSQPTSGTSTVVAVHLSKQLIETKAPPASSTVTLPSPVAVSITPVEHGPPCNVLPRHLLINVFRI